MDILIALFIVFAVLPFLALLWMPGWISFIAAAAVLLGLAVWFWVDLAMSPSSSGHGFGGGAAVANGLCYLLTGSVLAGIAIKITMLRRRLLRPLRVRRECSRHSGGELPRVAPRHE